MIRRLTTGILTGALAVTLAAPAAAHEHQTCTPGEGGPVLAEEPFHGDDPTGGAILNNPNVTPTAYASWGLHPVHHFLHIGPSADDRQITVVRTDTQTCP